MRDVLLRLFAISLVFPFDIYEFLRDSLLIALRRDRKIDAEHQGRLPEASEHRRLAIVAIRPSADSAPFLINLLESLDAHGFYVLAVSTKALSDDLAAQILPRCHWLIERFPIGRDFGSYKLGLRWMATRPNLANVDTLALVNDSVYYPATSGALLGDLLGQPGDWLCLFENTEALRHVQSFFMVFRGAVLRSDAFVNFWKRYQPYSSRKHAIRHGEVGLTTVLDRAGYIPTVLFNPARICRDAYERLRAGPLSEDFARVIWSTLNRPWMKVGEAQTLMESPTAALGFIAMLAERRGPTHVLGLLCNALYGAPIKRDISYRGHQLMVDVLLMCQGYTEAEREAMARDLWRKGPPMTPFGRGLARLPQWALYAMDRI